MRKRNKLFLVFGIGVIGIVSAVGLYLCSRIEGTLVEGAQLIRNEWGVGNYEVTLLAKTREWSREIPFLVEERKLTREEIKVLADRLQMELPELMKKENQNLKHVTGDLNLPSYITGYPFHLIWSSTDNERIADTGRVNREGISGEGIQVTLTALAVYEREQLKLNYEVTLLPEVLNKENAFFKLLNKELQEAKHKTETSNIIELPLSLNGEEIQWKEVRQSNGFWILPVIVSGSLFVCWKVNYERKKNCEKKKKQLLMDYSGFVSKFRLYLAAGLTVKNTFLKMTDDYAGEEKQKHYLYKEMKTACHQFENGMMEEQVYQEFGRRCEEMRYRRFGSLLSVHLKQGNGQLLLLLEKEAESALEDRRNLAKKAGEEAGTKLLIPMMLMLIVVMFLILLPAYFNFNSV